MPSLKQLTCTIDDGARNEPLAEFNTTYRDGFVETYVAVQSRPLPFTIHLTSQGYIAPGLAMFVYIDGVAQCNRNRQGLIVPKVDSRPEETEVDIRVRQKEVGFDNDRFIAREWTFEKLNIVAADDTQSTSELTHDNVGIIEVVVLRCRGDTEQATTNYTLPDKKITNGRSSKQHTGADMRLTSNIRKAAPRVIRDDESSGSGLMGLFDGACDEDLMLGLDGTGDEANNAHWGYENTGPTTGIYRPDRNRPYHHPHTTGNHLRQAQNVVDHPYQYYDPSRQAWMEQVTRAIEPPQYPFHAQPEVFHHGQPSFAHQGYPYYYPPYQPPYQGYGYPAGLHHRQPPFHHHGSELQQPIGGLYQSIIRDDVSAHQPLNQGLRIGRRPFTRGQHNHREPKNNHNFGNADQPIYEAEEGNNGNYTQSIVVNGPATIASKSFRHNSNHDADENEVGAPQDGNDAGPEVKPSTVVGDWDKNENTQGTPEVPAVVGTWDNNNTTQENNKNIADSEGEKKKGKGKAHAVPSSKPKRGDSAAQIGHPLSKAIDLNRPFIKSYWQDGMQQADSASPDPNSGKKRAAATYIVGEEPLAAIPKKVADEKQMSHQVRAGKGALYHHRADKVEYLDKMDNPYAVFVFNYRSLAKLKKILQDDKLRPAKGSFKKRLEAQTKEEVIEQLLKAKKRLNYNTDSSLDSGSDTVHTESDSDAAKQDGNAKASGAQDNVASQPVGEHWGGGGQPAPGQPAPGQPASGQREVEGIVW